MGMLVVGGFSQHFNMVQINNLISNTWLHAMLVHQQKLKMLANGKTLQIHHNFGSLHWLKWTKFVLLHHLCVLNWLDQVANHMKKKCQEEKLMLKKRYGWCTWGGGGGGRGEMLSYEMWAVSCEHRGRKIIQKHISLCLIIGNWSYYTQKTNMSKPWPCGQNIKMSHRYGQPMC